MPRPMVKVRGRWVAFKTVLSDKAVESLLNWPKAAEVSFALEQGSQAKLFTTKTLGRQRVKGSDQASARTRWAASTMFCRAALTSSLLRVFSPQSGLTQSRCGPTADNAARKLSTTSSVSGTRGE